MLTKPYRHQAEGLAWALRKPSGGLFWEPGVGKTWGALAIAEARRARLMIVPPARLIPNWLKEIGKHTTREPRAYLGNKRGRALDGDTVLISQEMFRVVFDPRRKAKRADEDKVRRLGGVKTTEETIEARRAQDEIAESFNRWIAAGQSMLVVDESHRLKDAQSAQSRALGMVAPRFTYRLIMTGTPVAHDLFDLWAQFRVVGREVFGFDAETSFRRYVAQAFRVAYKPQPEWRMKPGMDKWILGRAALFSHVRHTSDCYDLPPRSYETIECEMLPEQAKLYRRMEAVGMAIVDDETVSASTKLAELMKLRQIAGGVLDHKEDGEQTRHAVPSGKLEALKDVLKDYHGHHVAVWTSGDSVSETLRVAAEIKAGRIDGSVPIGDRLAMKDRWEAGPASPLVLSARAISEGVDIVGPHVAIYYSSPWSYIDREQSERRLWRPGQKGSVKIIDLVLRGTVDEDVRDALTTKQAVLDVVMGKRRAACGS